MVEQWYYSRAGKQTGPVSAAELKLLASIGQLSPTDHIWKTGMAKWVPATKVKGLFPAPVAPLAQRTAPSSWPTGSPAATAVDTATTVPQPMMAGGVATPNNGSRTSSRRRNPSSRIMIIVATAVLLLVAIGVAGFIVLRPTVSAVAEKRPEPRNDDEQLVKQFILNNAKDPKGVRFVSWGPHMLAREVQELRNAGATEFPIHRYNDDRGFYWPSFNDDPREQVGKKGKLALSFIRVRYHLSELDVSKFVEMGRQDELDFINERNAQASLDPIFDRIFRVVDGKRVKWWWPNADGDDWKKEVRRELAKTCPRVTAE